MMGKKTPGFIDALRQMLAASAVSQSGIERHQQRDPNESQFIIPDHVANLLRSKGQEASEGIVPVLRQLLQQSSSTSHVYLCHPHVQHVSKLDYEGSFCGYRNIQMIVSYINAAQSPGADLFDGSLPSVFAIQDYIEAAWDSDINAHGREETGGIRNTNKFIGTPEAQAMFCGLGIPCQARAFTGACDGEATKRLLEAVHCYFQDGFHGLETKIRQTELPPIYFQYPGHSLTIIGIEKRRGGEMNLLVFDPICRDSDAALKLVGLRFQHKSPDKLLDPYRRGAKFLRKKKEFEILSLSCTDDESTDLPTA